MCPMRTAIPTKRGGADEETEEARNRTALVCMNHAAFMSTFYLCLIIQILPLGYDTVTFEKLMFEGEKSEPTECFKVEERLF